MPYISHVIIPFIIQIRAGRVTPVHNKERKVYPKNKACHHLEANQRVHLEKSQLNTGVQGHFDYAATSWYKIVLQLRKTHFRRQNIDLKKPVKYDHFRKLNWPCIEEMGKGHLMTPSSFILLSFKND